MPPPGIEIYQGINGPGLGNHWRTINYVLRLSEQDKQPKYYDDSRWGNKAKAIYEVLDSPGKIIFINKNKDIPGKRIIKVSERHNLPYCPTKTKWQPGPYHQICYQFDGRSERNLKNPQSTDIQRFQLIFKKFKLVKLGGRKTLQEEIEIAAKSDLFVGVCSGMSHLCHSVGIPMFLLKYLDKFDRWHAGNPYTCCLGMEDAIEKISNYLKTI
jgi:hypothetical protein